MAVITISRELGSLGTYIARQTAQQLNIPLIDKNLIEKMLASARNQVIQNKSDVMYNQNIQWDLVDGDMVYLYDRVIRAAARWGDSVMLGRGTFAILSRYPDVLNVRIQAPFELRVQRVLTKDQLSHPSDVDMLVRESDRVRSVFIHDWYGVDWEAAISFNLIIDTSKIPTDLAVMWLTQGFQTVKEMSEPDVISTRTIEVDTDIQEAINVVLDQAKILQPEPISSLNQ